MLVEKWRSSLNFLMALAVLAAMIGVILPFLAVMFLRSVWCNSDRVDDEST